MDDGTALWLLSALLQSTATIWGLFLIVYLFHHKYVNDMVGSITISMKNLVDKQEKFKTGTERIKKNKDYRKSDIKKKLKELENEFWGEYQKHDFMLEGYKKTIKKWNFSKSLKLFYFFNLLMFVTISSTILGLLLFRNELLIWISVIFSLSVFGFVAIFSVFIFRLSYSLIRTQWERRL